MTDKTNVHRIGSVGQLIDGLEKLYAEGNIQGIVIGILRKDELIESWWSGDSFLQRLGMAENLKVVMNLRERGII
jgi:hypothetical protein